MGRFGEVITIANGENVVRKSLLQDFCDNHWQL